MPARRLTAGWVIPIESRPIERGAMLVGEDGRIQAVGPDASVPRPPQALVEDFADSALLPGLVNTHTHLELTGLKGQETGPDFAAWIIGVRDLKAARSSEQFLAAARRGVASCFAAGVTAVADTGDSGTAIRALAEAGVAAVAYHEVFGPHADDACGSLRGLQRSVAELAAYATGRLRLGVSPHAPYTVSGPLYAATSRWARAEGLPVAVHLAESTAEFQLLSRGTGAFADLWRERKIPLPSPLGRTPVEWLDDHGVLGHGTLCIHLVQAGPSDLDRIARSGSAVAHCPLSNRAHQHGDAPVAGLLSRGVRVGLGTDSVLSVGRLDLLAEARAARLLAGINAEVSLALCTLGGARALGLEAEIGSLVPGKWGDCTVIRCAAGPDGRAPYEQLLASGPDAVLATFVGGRDVYRAGHPV
ncbi:MAG: amidohydrolase family protein [Gemmatimonadales bacterium]|nr:amidohydrolase family protein [Gemmatimonadales bacterium]